MTPTIRKLVYAVSFETLGIAVSSLGLWAISSANPTQSLALSVIGASIALSWSFVFNTVFEAWEARQPVKGRSPTRRAIHALGFEGGLILIAVPIMAWWLDVTLWQAASYEAALIGIFILYTYAFTWAFDRIFGLPASARPH